MNLKNTGPSARRRLDSCRAQPFAVPESGTPSIPARRFNRRLFPARSDPLFATERTQTRPGLPAISDPVWRATQLNLLPDQPVADPRAQGALRDLFPSFDVQAGQSPPTPFVPRRAPGVTIAAPGSDNVYGVRAVLIPQTLRQRCSSQEGEHRC